MREILEEIERWREAGERVAVGTVVATRRSAPRPVGSSLAVSESGKMAGSVSGGCVESEVYEHAREVLAGGEPRLLSYGIADEDAWEIGLPCGGEIDVAIVETAARFPLERLFAERAVYFTVVEGSGAGAQLLAFENGDRLGEGVPKEAIARLDEVLRGGRNRLLELADGTKVFAEWYGPPPRLFVYGAVDLAEALCRASKLLGWTAIVADARGKFATPERIPSADELIVAWPEEALAQVAPDHQTAVVVLTHEDRFDVPLLRAALGTEAFYVGALGSRRNQERRRGRLLEAGVAEETLGRIAGPCGLDIGAASIEETALSIMAEILAVRAGREGGPLMQAGARIHAESV